MELAHQMPRQSGSCASALDRMCSFSIFFSGCKQPNFSTCAPPFRIADAKIAKIIENWELRIENFAFFNIAHALLSQYDHLICIMTL